MKAVAVLISVCIAGAACQKRPPASAPGSGRLRLAVEHVVVHNVPEAERAHFASSAKPIPIPRITLKEFLDRMPAGLRRNPLRQDEGLEATEFDIGGEGTRGGDGKAFVVTNEYLAKFPYNVVGKISSSGGSCSGAVIGPHLVLTAGHCVQTGGGGVYTDVYFQPGYPLHGTWYAATKAFVHPYWAKNGAHAFDYAFLFFEGGMNVQYYWGIVSNVNWGLKRPCNPGEQCYRGAATSWGYPAEGPYKGELQYFDPVRHSCWACSAGELVFKIVGMDYWDLAGGASGGPWLTSAPQAGGRVEPEGVAPQGYKKYAISGLNSFEFVENPGEIWSPQFTAEADDIQAVYRDIVRTHPR